MSPRMSPTLTWLCYTRGFADPHPGQLPCGAGVIIIGGNEDTKADLRPDWAKDGSLMVFRKLQQFVPEFERFLIDNPLNATGLLPEEASALRGAKMVGRWKSVSFNYSTSSARDSDLTYIARVHLSKLPPRKTTQPSLTIPIASTTLRTRRTAESRARLDAPSLLIFARPLPD